MAGENTNEPRSSKVISQTVISGESTNEPRSNVISQSIIAGESTTEPRSKVNSECSVTRSSALLTQESHVDRGYAWVVMVAVFATIVLHAAFGSTQTLLYQALLANFQLDASTAAAILSLSFGIRYLSSPAVGLLYQSFSHRTVAMSGALLYTLGILLTAFAPTLVALYLAGVLLGLGGNMVVMTTLVILPLYFSKNRGKAMSFAFCGNGIGTMIFPPLIARSFSNFGYTQTLIFQACVMLQFLVTAALFRPISKQNNIPAIVKSKWQNIKEYSGLSLIGRPVLMLLILVISSVQCQATVAFIFLSGLGIEQANLSANQVATALSVAAFIEFCKLPLGPCFDLPRVRPYRMYLFCSFCVTMGVLAILLTFCTSMLSFTACFAAYNLFAMGTLSQFVTMLGDLVQTEELPATIGLCRTVTGGTLLLVPPAIGRIKDVFNSFQYGFILISIVHIVLAVGYSVAYFCWTRRHKVRMQTEVAMP